jgi:glutathione S-transferase
MTLTLIGHYDSPFVRRVGISLHLLAMPFERQVLSVFGDADKLRAYNPVGRVPALVLDDGEVLVDSAAILDHLDQVVVPERALLPASGKARRDALQKVVLATGINDKAVAITYERRHRGDAADAGWIARCRGQQDAALAGLEKLFAAEAAAGSRLMQPEITVATMLGYVRLRQPETLPPDRYPALEAWWCGRRPIPPSRPVCLHPGRLAGHQTRPERRCCGCEELSAQRRVQ